MIAQRPDAREACDILAIFGAVEVAPFAIVVAAEEMDTQADIGLLQELISICIPQSTALAFAQRVVLMIPTMAEHATN
jgi:hypothetical protein